MDQSSGKRGTGGRKTYTATEGSQNAQFCNRIGCSGRIKFSGLSDKSKSPFRSSSGNEVTGKSSRNSSISTTTKRSCFDSKRKMFDQSESSLSTESEAGSSSLGPRRTFRSKSELHNRTTSPSASRSSAVGPFNGNNGSRYGLRNLRCNSMSDAVPPSCSQLEPESTRKNSMKNISSEGESSSSNRGNRHSSPATTGSSSSWNRRSMSVNTRTRFSGRQDGRNSSSIREPSPSRNDYEIPLNVDGSSSQQFSVSGLRSHRRSSNSSDNSSSRTSFASAESGLMNRDVLHRFNIDGIAEVLFALERIDQDEELTHEQIVSLETSLFLSGLNLYDQHRDMRLDIDNMSYEELLALEERMGSVSTALSEEAMSKCMRRSVYMATPSTLEVETDDIKCSICQEEYATGDEIGELVECQHGYHATCINQWLQQKNWCPICKASAAPKQ